jgi:phage baseplate assembly protein W
MAGMNRQTLRPLGGMDHVGQSLDVIFSTEPGTRVMREWFGSPGNKLLGNSLTRNEVSRWWSIIWAAITIFEPRFIPRRLGVKSATSAGGMEIEVAGDYRLYAHLGFEQAALYIAITSDGVVVRRAA